MEILNYAENAPGTPTVATFSIWLPEKGETLHKYRLIKTKKGGHFVAGPSYREERPDGEKVYFPYRELTKEKADEFQKEVIEALKPFVRIT